MKRAAREQVNNLPTAMQTTITLVFLLVGFVGMGSLGHCAYVDKTDTSLASTAEPVLRPGTSSVLASQPEEYPYYGNAPADMLPYRNIEPYYRYWLTRLPFRGPGRDYPDPTNLTSLKVGLLSPAPYGPEAKRGEMSREGVMLTFEEANAGRALAHWNLLRFELLETSEDG